MSDAGTDRELLRSWRAGDNDAGDELIRRHFDSVYRFFRTKIERGIEDLVQRTFLGCVEGRDRIRDDLSFRAYLLGIARRQLWLVFRAKARHGVEVNLSEQSIHDLEESPSRWVAQRQEQKILLRALQRIPIELQIVVELHYWEAMKIAEIAHVLDAPEGTIKRRLFRARELLRARIAEVAESEALAASTVDNLERWARSLAKLAGPGGERGKD